MAHKPSEKKIRRRPEDPEINIIPAMSLMVILIPFLLLTAVFGKASILNLYLPTESDPNKDSPPALQKIIPTVAITQRGFILSRGKGNVKRIPLKERQHDFSTLREDLMNLQESGKAGKNIVILPEAGTRYQLLITTMDTCRQYRTLEGERTSLFPIISLGEYQAKIAGKGK